MNPPVAPGEKLDAHLGLLAVACLLCGCASLPGASRTASAGGWNDCAQAGSGAPVVVFEGGIGERMETWDKVFAKVARSTTAFAYSRRGYGGSGPVSFDRDGETSVRELRALLAARGLSPPYVLVGHSLGGLYAQLFAKQYPDEVAGAVLVDPTPVDHLERLRSELPDQYATAQKSMRLQAASVQDAELLGIDATSREWHRAGPFPERPMIVLTGVKAGSTEEASIGAYKERAHLELLEQWPGAQHRRVESGHFIQRDAPNTVVAVVEEVVGRVRAGKRAR